MVCSSRHRLPQRRGLGRPWLARSLSRLAIMLCMLPLAVARDGSTADASDWEKALVKAAGHSSRGNYTETVALARDALSYGIKARLAVGDAAFTKSDEAFVQNVLGSALTATDSIVDARKHLTAALVIRQAEKSDPLLVATVLIGLAAVNTRDGDYAAADSQVSDAAVLLQGVPWTIASVPVFESFAMVAIRCGSYVNGMRIVLRCLKIRRKGTNPTERSEISALFAGSVASFYLGGFEAAEAGLANCLERAKRRLGLSHPRTLGALQALARVYVRLGKFDFARATLDEWKETSKLRGERMSVQDRAMNLLVESELLAAQKKTKECDTALQSAMNLLRDGGVDHRPDYGECALGLGQLYRGDPKRAVGHLLVAEKVFRKAMGDSHPRTLRVRILVIQSRAEADRGFVVPDEYAGLIDDLAKKILDEHPDIKKYRSWKRP